MLFCDVIFITLCEYIECICSKPVHRENIESFVVEVNLKSVRISVPFSWVFQNPSERHYLLRLQENRMTNQNQNRQVDQPRLFPTPNRKQMNPLERVRGSLTFFLAFLYFDHFHIFDLFCTSTYPASNWTSKILKLVNKKLYFLQHTFV